MYSVSSNSMAVNLASLFLAPGIAMSISTSLTRVYIVDNGWDMNLERNMKLIS
jgi:hypothetical protein